MVAGINKGLDVWVFARTNGEHADLVIVLARLSPIVWPPLEGRAQIASRPPCETQSRGVVHGVIRLIVWVCTRFTFFQ